MTVWFVSRHPGAVFWAKRRQLHVDRWVSHLLPDEVKEGDIVIGTLPMGIAAEVCQKGVRYFTLDIALAESDRGRELTESELESLNCTLKEVSVTFVDDSHK